MLTLANRAEYQSLLDAVTLNAAGDPPAIIYVASDAPPIYVSRDGFAAAAGISSLT